MLYRGVGTVLANVALNFVLLKSLGVPGIALSTAIVAVGTCCFMVLTVQRAIRSEQACLKRETADKAISQCVQRAA